MARLYENELICDFAETYRILDWRALPSRLAATLAAGLREDSRVMRRISGERIGLSDMLAAMTTDAVRVLIWQNTKDGQRGRNQPVSVLEALMRPAETDKEEIGFEDPEEFRRWREQMLGGEADGQRRD